MRTERKRIQSFLLLVISCVLLFAGFGCGGGSGQAAAPFNDPNSSQNSPPPPIVDLLSNPPPPASNWVSAIPSANQVYLDWSDESSREDGFIVLRDGVEIARNDRNDSKYTDTAVSPATAYSYKVVAFNKEGSNASPEKIVTTLPLPPTAPSNLVAQADSSGVTLSWADNSDNETGFQVEKDGVVIATVPVNITEYKDIAVLAGNSYCYRANAVNTGGKSGYSDQICITIPYPNQPPQVWLEYPLADELVYKLTRVMVKWQDADDRYLNLRIFINNTEVENKEVKTSPNTSSQWFEINFADKPDGDYVISVEVYDSQGVKAGAQVNVRINATELEQKAIDYLKNHNIWGIWEKNSDGIEVMNFYVRRWPFLPLPVKINPLFGQSGYDSILRALNFYTRFTGITFAPEWGNAEIIYSDCSYISAGWNPIPPDAQYLAVVQPNTLPCNKEEKGAVGHTDSVAIYQGVIIGPTVIDITPDWISAVGADSEIFERLVAHEIGHAVGIHGHEQGEYLMPWNLPIYRLSPEMSRALEMLYFELQPGDPLPFL